MYLFDFYTFQERDTYKHKQAAEKSITIIDIPFWWNWDEERYEQNNIQQNVNIKFTTLTNVKFSSKYKTTEA